jgi:heterodisulfide reductase subunit C
MQTFLEQVNEKIDGVPLQRCYHCRKCTAGCPLAFAMEYNPNKVIRMIQMDRKKEVLGSSTIWLCASCETCITRCPNEVDIARMMDALRQMAIESGVGAKEKNVLKFHESCLCNNKKVGPVHHPPRLGSLLRYGHGHRHVPEGQVVAVFPENEGSRVRQENFREDEASLKSVNRH